MLPGCRRLRDSDLLRLFGLHGYRYWLCTTAGYPLSRQFQCSLQSPEPIGFLAPVAHFAFQLAARLPLHSTRG